MSDVKFQIVGVKPGSDNADAVSFAVTVEGAEHQGKVYIFDNVVFDDSDLDDGDGINVGVDMVVLENGGIFKKEGEIAEDTLEFMKNLLGNVVEYALERAVEEAKKGATV